MHISDISLDLWLIILSHFTTNEMVCVFHRLRAANIFHRMPYLDTFWSVATMARARESERVDEFDAFPDVALHKEGVVYLTELGVPNSIACDVMSRARGNMEYAMMLLHWD